MEYIFDWHNRPNIFSIYIMKNVWIHVQEHSVRLLKEKGSERLHGTIDIIPSLLQLFTAVHLSSPFHRVPLFTPRVHTPALNIHIRKYFDGDKFSQWNNIRITNFHTSPVQKYFHYKKG